MHVGRSAGRGRDELGVLVEVEVVLVAVVVLSALLRPASIDIFLCPLGRDLAPVDGCRVGLDDGIGLAPVALNGDRRKGGIDDLAAFEFDPRAANA